MNLDDWYYVSGNDRYGPVPFQVLQTLARSGEISHGDLVWTDGMPDWVEAISIQGLVGIKEAAAARPRGGRRRKSGRPMSRRPGRSRGSAGTTIPTHPSTETAKPRPTPTMGKPASPVAGPRDPVGDRRSARPIGTPGTLMVAGLLKLTATGLMAFAGTALVDAESFCRTEANQVTTQSDIDRWWAFADQISTAATLTFTVAALFAALAFVLFTGQRWGPAVQTVVSGLAAVPYLVAIPDVGNQALAVPGFAEASTFAWLIIVFLLAPVGFVWTPGVQAWLKSKHSTAPRRGASPRDRRR